MSVRFNRFVSALGILMVASTALPLTWQLYSSDAGNFEVGFPAKPTSQKLPLDTDAGKVDYFFFSAVHGERAFYVAYCDYDRAMVSAADPKSMLDAARNGTIYLANTLSPSSLRSDC
jgi:hypothetical protein